MIERETVDPDVAAWYQSKSSLGTQFRGLSVINHDREIHGLIRATGSVRLLDYGCGLGHQYTEQQLHKRWGVPMPTLYDPGVAGLDTKPQGRFDGVICSDVLEHVPEELVDNVIAELFDYAERFLWASVCCRPAKKFFDPDTRTRNLHLTVQPQKWWVDRFFRAANGRRHFLVFTP